MRKPDFIIFGAPKSGTTSVYHYLQQHPQVQMSLLKEPHFFLFDGSEAPRMNGPHDGIRRREMLTDWDKYQALFKPVSNESVCGEASIRYLYSRQACQSIQHRLPKIKLIAILRHPVDRAFSAFQRDRVQGTEALTDFAESIADCQRREDEGWFIGSHQSLGYYGKYLEPYFQTFSSEQLRVYLYDDLLNEPNRLMRELFEFLEVDASFKPDLSQYYNVTGTIENPFWRFLWQGTRRVRSHLMPWIPMRLRGSFFSLASRFKVRKASSEKLDPSLRAKLTMTYHDDILHLQDLMQRDLSSWLEIEPKQKQ